MTPLPVQPSLILSGGFIALSITVVVLLASAIKSRKLCVSGFVLIALFGIISATGYLSDFSGTPPRIALFFILITIGTIILAFSNVGRKLSDLSINFLIGFQAFRIPVETLIHRATVEGVAPPQMSWDGMNFDILSGLSALVLFPFASKLPRWSIMLWNSISLGLLLWIVGVAILSFPSSFQQLKPDNIWVAHFPFIWLPTVAVTSALLMHIVVFRKLLRNK